MIDLTARLSYCKRKGVPQTIPAAGKRGEICLNLPMNDKGQLNSRIFSLVQPVLDSVSEMQGIWLKFVDASGEHIVTTQSTSPCNFCQYVRSTEIGLSRCRQSAGGCIEKSRQNRGPIKARCHAGLSTIAVPIMIEGKCLGVLTANEMVEQHLYDNSRQLAAVAATGLGISREKLAEYLDEIPLWTEKRIEVVLRSLDAMSNRFIEIGKSGCQIHSQLKMNQKLFPPAT